MLLVLVFELCVPVNDLRQTRQKSKESKRTDSATAIICWA